MIKMAYYAITGVECGEHYSTVVLADNSVQAIEAFKTWLLLEAEETEVFPWIVSVFRSETEIT